MFQRLRGELKGAFDTIADEQNRLRAQQVTSAPTQRSTSQPQPQAARPARPRLPTSELSGPDADPSHFVVGDETPALGTPEPSKVNGPILETSTQDLLTSEAALEAVLSTAHVQTNGEGGAPAGDMSAEVQAKLRKLNKLESKYSELLKAYRRAHARNSLIEPFEARLRETTPLTSISDPEALVEYVSQLNAKGDMVMGELKKVSEEKDTLKLKLDEAEQKTKAAYEEVAQLQEPSKKEADPTAAPSPVTDKDVTATNIAPPIASSPKIVSLGKNLFSPRQPPMQLSEEANRDMFSVEDEVPKLQSELQERKQEIEQLHSQSQLLKGELATARESAEHMMTDFEKAQKELERIQAEHSESEEHKENQITQLKHTIVVLEGEVETAKEDLVSARLKIGTHEQETNNLQVTKTRLEKELEDLRANNAQEPELPAEVMHSLEPSVETSETANLDAAARKKKNKKKKKKGAATTAEAEQLSTTDSVATDPVIESAASSKISTVSIDATAQLKEKDEAIDRLHAKLKSQDDLLEEIEGLKDDLLSIGQEHVEAKEKIKEIEAENDRLQKRCDELELQLTSLDVHQTQKETLQSEAKSAAEKLDSLEREKDHLQSRVKTLETGIANLNTQAQTSLASSQVREELSKNFEDLRTRSTTLESDLTAAQQLATTRYREMASLRDLLSKAQTELTPLRTEVSELKLSRDELASRSKELRKLELREESLRNEVETLKKDTASKDSDVTSLRQKVTQETNSRIAAEETNRRTQRDLQRAQVEASSVGAERDAVSSQLTGSNQQFEESRIRLEQLERQVEQLTSQSDTLRDQISLKTAQHASAESLMRSARDQASEMATQMKEAQGRCENLEEELNDAHRLMSERGREGETMRRLLSEVEQRAESRVKEMRERMEMAVQERDRAEDEANSVGRRRTREVEEVKGKLRDAEREVRRVKEDKEDLGRTERDLRRQKDDDLKRIEGTTRDLEDVRRAMAELRDALDDGEKQTRDFEVERNTLKRSLDEAQQRVEKLQKSNKTLTDDLRSLRSTRMRPTDSPVQSSRSSHESARRVASPVGTANNAHMPMSPSNTSLRGSVSSQSTNSIDFVYLKNVLLQFLEKKDKQHQMQLVPVLSMLLKFDKRDEQKWTAAIAAK